MEVLNVASFFSGAGGFDLGFEKAGYNIVFGNDNWEKAAETFRKNFPESYFIEGDIENITKESLKKILKERGVKKIDIVIGGPPCQCFTRLNNNKLRKDDERNQLFREYVRVIKILSPDFVVMENVADLLARKDEKNRPFKELICGEFRKAGYNISYKIFKTEKYGVPQKRRRIIFLATKKNIDLSFPEESKKITKVGDFLKKIKNLKNLKNIEIIKNEPNVLARIKLIPQGGYYEDLPEKFKTKKVREGKLVTVKRYGSYYRRLSNSEPAPTITNNYIIHPTKNRYLTNREKAILHTFPFNFAFYGRTGDVSQQIANAVPPKLAQKIAKHILKINYAS